MTHVVFGLLVFLAVGSVFLFIHMLMGKVIRPDRPDDEKLTVYECGEPTVGSAWIQFDLRYYVVALLFVVFDVEVAFFFPWAVVFGGLNDLAHQPDEAKRQEIVARRQLDPGLALLPEEKAQLDEDGNKPTISQETAHAWAWVAFTDILVFFGVLMMGFAYLWRRGDIDWVRTTIQQAAPAAVPRQAALEETVAS